MANVSVQSLSYADLKSESVATSALRKYLRRSPFWLNPNQPDSTVTVPASGSVGPFVMMAGADGPLLVRRLGATGSEDIRVDLFRGSHSLNNAPISIYTIGGSSITAADYSAPIDFGDPLYVPSLGSMSVKLYNDSTSDVDVNMSFEATRFGYNMELDNDLTEADKVRISGHIYPYWYTLDTGGYVFTGSDASKYISISPDHHFQLMGIVQYTTDNILAKINMTDVTSNQSIIAAPLERNYAINGTLICGANVNYTSSNFPFWYTTPITFFAGSKIRVDISGGTTSETMNLTLIGRALSNAEAKI
jgi:hypothetical protein